MTDKPIEPKAHPVPVNGHPGQFEPSIHQSIYPDSNTWPPVKNVYVSQFTAEQIKAATDKNGCLCVGAINEIRFHSGDEMKIVVGADAPPDQSAEQQARDMLERLGVPGAQSLSAGDVAELAELIANQLTQKK